MKKILFAALICIIALSCEENSKYAIEREQKEAELKQIRDSLSNEDIKLSFMGIAIGGDVCQIDSAVNLGKIKIDSCSNGIYIGTIHGLANKFLVTHGISTGKLIEDEEFDEFFTLLQKNPSCVKHIPIILLDEAQDSSWEEFNFIFNMIQPEQFFVCGDIRQSIYGFRGA